MPQYNPPLRDMQFVMHEVLDATTLLKELPLRGADGKLPESSKV